MKSSSGVLVQSAEVKIQLRHRKLVRWFGQLTSDSTTRKAVLSLSDQAVVSGTGFLTSVIIGRWCTQQQLGVYYLALTLVLLMMGIQAELITAPYTVYRQRRRGFELAAYSGSTLIHQLVLCALSTLCVMITLSGAMLGWGTAELIPVLWILLGAAPFLLLRGFIRQFEFAGLRFATVLVMDLLVAMVQLGGLYLLARYQLLGIAEVYAVMGGGCAAACTLWLLSNRQPLRFQPKRYLADWRRNWSFARWAMISHLIGCSTPYIMPWILAWSRGAAATGSLAACETLVGLSYMFVTAIANLLTPQAARAFARGGNAALKRVLCNTALLFAAVLGPFCLFVLVTGDLLMVTIYGSKYAGTGTICVLFAVSVLINSMSIAAGNGLWAIDKPQANLWADCITLLATLAAAFTLVVPFGLLGAASATLIGNAAGAVVRCLTLWHIMRVIQPEQ